MKEKSDQFIADMFCGTLKQERPMDGIMGNGDYDEFERGEIEKLMAKLKTDDLNKILDAGTGIGRNIEILKRVGYADISACDFCPDMVEAFKNRYPEIPCIEADLTDLSEYPDNSFDVVFIMYVFIHIVDDDNLQKAIAEIERITRPDGLVVFGQVMDAENKIRTRQCVVREIFEIMPMFKEKKLEHFYKNLYELHSSIGDKSVEGGWTNKVSFAVFK